MTGLNEDLLVRAQAGDVQAWQCLLAEIYPEALRQARTLLRDRDLAEDAVQNALLKVYLHIGSLKAPSAFPGWWRRILTNETYLILRLYRRETQGIPDGVLRDSGLAMDEWIGLRFELAKAVQDLVLEQQQVFIEVDLKGTALMDVARESGWALGTVKSRLFRAREKLRSLLGEFGSQRKETRAMAEDFTQTGLRVRFYDYLEGTMGGAERAVFEEELELRPEWGLELKKHKDFLTLLHALTGKLALSPAEVADKIKQVTESVEDYEKVEEVTYFEQGVAQTLPPSHIWFKRPRFHRVESTHPSWGGMHVIVRESEGLTLMEKNRQATWMKVSDAFADKMDPGFADTLRTMAADKSSSLLGTEFIEGRPALHIQFKEQVSGKGEMTTHLWMDKETWMPLVTEWYDVEGRLVQRKIVRELRLNQGLPDSLFELSIPEGYVVTDKRQEELRPIEEISWEEAASRLGFAPYLLQVGLENEPLKAKNQWVTVSPERGALLSQYTELGKPFPKLMITQGPINPTNLPAGVKTKPERFVFDQQEVEGKYVATDLYRVKGMLIWQTDQYHFSLGGDYELDELKDLAARLKKLD
ncbi:ECF RNA polymerase sigma factor SigM [Peptococcaceae bacterium CEB3]|nr:ECF RNA polymerase sigma factor SigM [Peptococcaceae bacterium CEB3]